MISDIEALLFTCLREMWKTNWNFCSSFAEPSAQVKASCFMAVDFPIPPGATTFKTEIK